MGADLWNTVRTIRELAVVATSATLDATQTIEDSTRLAVEEGADPHIVLQSLVNGMATVLRDRIPPECREEVANEVLVLLYRQLDAMDVAGGGDLFSVA